MSHACATEHLMAHFGGHAASRPESLPQLRQAASGLNNPTLSLQLACGKLPFCFKSHQSFLFQNCASCQPLAFTMFLEMKGSDEGGETICKSEMNDEIGDGEDAKDKILQVYKWENTALYVQIQSTQANYVDMGEPFMDRLAKIVNDAMQEASEKIKKAKEEMPEMKELAKSGKAPNVRVWKESKSNRRLDENRV